MGISMGVDLDQIRLIDLLLNRLIELSSEPNRVVQVGAHDL